MLRKELKNQQTNGVPTTPFVDTDSSAPSLPLDLSSPGFMEDPYPVYQYLRQHEPIHKSYLGAFLFTRYEDVNRLFASKELGNVPSKNALLSVNNRDKYFSADVASNILPFQDGEQQQAIRRQITALFYDNLRRNPPPLRKQADEVLQLAINQDELDVLADFATPFVVKTMMELFSIPQDRQQEVLAYTHDFFYLFAIMPDDKTRQRVDKSLELFRTLFLEIINQSRDESSLLYQLKQDSLLRSLPEEQLADLAMLFFADGIENVDKQIANTVLLLQQNPEQLAKLKQNEELLKKALEESLRLESAAQFVPRICQQNFQYQETTIKQGDIVFLMIGAANRDDVVFDNPDVFSLDRKNAGRHLGFGKGRHSCIGANLVYLQLEAALQSYLELAGEFTRLEAYRWQHRWGHRWLEYLVFSR